MAPTVTAVAASDVGPHTWASYSGVRTAVMMFSATNGAIFKYQSREKREGEGRGTSVAKCAG